MELLPHRVLDQRLHTRIEFLVALEGCRRGFRTALPQAPSAICLLPRTVALQEFPHPVHGGAEPSPAGLLLAPYGLVGIFPGAWRKALASGPGAWRKALGSAETLCQSTVLPDLLDIAQVSSDDLPRQGPGEVEALPIGLLLRHTDVLLRVASDSEEENGSARPSVHSPRRLHREHGGRDVHPQHEKPPAQ
ncbi:hypothetical protein ACQEU8_03815 [Streptomyces sp. CA-250714]|uniref:hypothetical protein n=1 Tax=Streptomyces sp. CA-250714 TaxID=3240060 RepID=UPI003D8F6CE6